MVVDDEPFVRELLAAFLADAYEVRTASDGLQCLELVCTGERFDVILSDLRMPCMGGLRLYEALTSAAHAQAARMVFVTGGATTEEDASFLDRPDIISMRKPFTQQQVLSAVGACLLRAEAISEQKAR